MTDTTKTNETTQTTPTTATEVTTPPSTDTTSQTTTSEPSKGSSEPENILDSLKKEAGKKDETTTTTPPEKKEGEATPPTNKEDDKSKPDDKAAEIEYELELPKDSSLTEKDIEEIAKMAEKYKLPKEEAENLIAEREALVKRGHEALMTKAHDVVKAEKEKISKDPAFQGEKLAETLDHIDIAINKYGDEDLKVYLRGPGGNNLGLLKFLSKIGSLGASDKVHGKGGTASDIDNSEEARLARLYPSQFAKK